ncbi:SIR2 family NAD-dependent protein deacylase [Tautonia plasticadhaerens]|uniref:protein acetyllysine N-acetyltransferase n=1 Tax=Tautonia plasticadhaerens TaxID=2527974 RepID=A0A518HD67_9BACT|nr:Sir2 family NAD-dependent protein deacetylase [Tautonia plasticadhaerens]QDV38773.1 NAD-dependent protein deacylase [Tautonia plasticadhaerens]
MAVRFDDTAISRAAEAVANAGALLVGAGAGMGVDSGLPDFRGREGFWRAYPAAERLGLSFFELANPRWFRQDPALAWGFYGHRSNLYRATSPHPGFAILRRWMEGMPAGGFVYTSNVDGHFQKAGFPDDRVLECHGAIGRLQCVSGCGIGPFDAGPSPLVIDADALRAADPLPSCPGCGGLARPNILMFGDGDWDPSATDAQQRRFEAWLLSIGEGPLVVVECGAGKVVPTVRLLCERAARHLGGTLIRINLRDDDVPDGQVGLPLGALEGLDAIDRRIGSTGRG